MMAAAQQAQMRADAAAYQQYTFAHEGLEGVPILGVEALGQAAAGAYNEIKQNGGVSAATVSGVAITAAASMLHIPGAQELPALRQAYVGEVRGLEDWG